MCYFIFVPRDCSNFSQIKLWCIVWQLFIFPEFTLSLRSYSMQFFLLPKFYLSWTNYIWPIDVLIYVTHKFDNKRKYGVVGLTKDGASTQTFPFEKGGYTVHMTVQKYFEKELNVRLKYNMFISILKGVISFRLIVFIWCFSSRDFVGNISWLETAFTELLSPFLHYYLCIFKKISKCNILILTDFLIFWPLLSWVFRAQS